MDVFAEAIMAQCGPQERLLRWSARTISRERSAGTSRRLVTYESRRLMQVAKDGYLVAQLFYRRLNLAVVIEGAPLIVGRADSMFRPVEWSGVRKLLITQGEFSDVGALRSRIKDLIAFYVAEQSAPGDEELSRYREDFGYGC